MRHMLIFLLSVGIFSAAAAQRVKGSGDQVTQQRNVNNFSQVDVNSAIRVMITQGSKHSVTIKADDNIIDRVITEVRSDRLIVKLPSGNYNNITVNVEITMPKVTGLTASGASRMEARGFNNQRGEELEVTASGASKIYLDQGKFDHIDATASGASQVDIADVRAETAQVSASGASSISLSVDNKIRGSASGASSVRYSGNPGNVDVNTSGASRVRGSR